MFDGETNYGKGGPSMAAVHGVGDHLRQHYLLQMVPGDQLWWGTNCGMTDPVLFTYLGQSLSNSSMY